MYRLLTLNNIHFVAATKVKKRCISDTAFFYGGSGGIRTHVPFRTTAFRVRLVTTTSIRFQFFHLLLQRCVKTTLLMIRASKQKVKSFLQKI